MDTAQFIIEVVNFFGLNGVSKSYSRAVQKFYKQNGENRIQTLAAAARLIEAPSTQKEWYAVSTAYVWAGAKYRRQAINALEGFLRVGGYWGEDVNKTGSRSDKFVSVKEAAIADTYTNLGMAYEGEYQFGEAISAYEQAIKHWYSAPHNYVKLSIAHTKNNDIDAAISVLINAYQYMRDEIDKNVIRKYLNEAQSKKSKGYIYRPRATK